MRGRIPVASYFPTYLERKRDLTPSTRNRYEGIGCNYIVPGRLGSLQLVAVTRDDVEEWINDLIRAGVGASTVEKAYRTVRAMFNQALKEGKVAFNPASAIKTPPPVEREPFFMTADEIDRIVDAAAPRERGLIYFLTYTGVRMGEACGLRVRNLDLKKGRVVVRESSSEVGGRVVMGRTKTKNVRAVELSSELVTELNTYLSLFGQRRPDGTLDPDAFVFTGARGGQIRQNNWRTRVFQPAARKAGVTRIGRNGTPEAPRAHDLRHTFASLAASNGWTLHEVKEALGHSDISITSRLYLHLFADDKREKAQRLGKLIKAPDVAEEAEVLPLAGDG
jgi:integrase